MTCTGYGTAVACQYNNTGTATGTSPTGATATATDQSWYYGNVNRRSRSRRHQRQHVTAAPGPTINVGGAVTWTYVVTNSGDVALSNVVVSDDHHVSVSCPKSTLQSGETMTCTGSGTGGCGAVPTMSARRPGSRPAARRSARRLQLVLRPVDAPATPPSIAIKKYTNGQYVTCAPGPTLTVGSR